MGALKLTPEAKIERGQRLQAEGRRLETEGLLEQLGSANDCYNQDTCGIAKRRYLADARAGKFPTTKLGEKVLVKREDFWAYLDREGIKHGAGRRDDEDVDDVVEGILKAGGSR